ncbi:hypothetical protein H5395_02030 [Paracoccus sp. MC1854]|uniref:antiviral reverse transcriptase Drt2 n=1 Tax=Paracoccus sp. MC1854 TaxID=2760306 RepID=UPI0016048233|nr:antiviral reverse transcriptase Drt2 [Paracoccus sp. MC1854]MBB1490329.1 hypothetical protein [Paracoccus sp. MC1854]
MSGLDLLREGEFDPSTSDLVHKFQARERKYLHFDNRLTERRREISYDFEIEETPHRFYPLLGYTKLVRRVTLSASGEPQVVPKPREIKYASHRDSAYLEAYSSWLSLAYEAELKKSNLDRCVLAYRKGNATNIHHAKALFDEVAHRADCVVTALDIKGFFDSLLHQHLKHELLELLDAGRLEGHHWTIFKNVTRYSWVEQEALEVALGPKRKKKGRICTAEEYVTKVRGKENNLIRVNKNPWGIPQGTPISGLYANIYLLSFDRRMLRYANSIGGTYRRYSDDIAVVAPPHIRPEDVVQEIERAISSYGLQLSTHKTELSVFSRGLCQNENRPLQYLGFTYDGRKFFIRTASMLRYQKKMRQGIRAKLIAAKAQGIPSRNVYQRQLLSRYTHLGKGRNFVKYAYRAAEIMNAPSIRHQIKNHPRWFQRAWHKEVIRAYGDLVTSA